MKLLIYKILLNTVSYFLHGFKNATKPCRAILLALSLLFLSCVQAGLINENGEEDTEHLVAILLLAIQPCTIGGYSFSKSGLDCTLNGASGSGTLTALAAKNEFVSFTLDFQLYDTGSSIQVVTGGTPETDSTTANYYKIMTGATELVGVTSTSAGVTAGTSDQSWCFETHFEENPDHMIFDNYPCASKAVSSAQKDAEGTGVTRDTTGGTWGFVLTNAGITGLFVNQAEVFSE